MNIFTSLTVEEANQFLADRGKQYSKADDEYKCGSCGSTIMQTTLYASVHDKGLGMCAGGGEVRKTNYPYCPSCDGDLSTETLRACIHV